jgi:hypothetical protein
MAVAAIGVGDLDGGGEQWGLPLTSVAHDDRFVLLGFVGHLWAR